MHIRRSGGFAEHGITPGTRLADIPGDWRCPSVESARKTCTRSFEHHCAIQFRNALFHEAFTSRAAWQWPRRSAGSRNVAISRPSFEPRQCSLPRYRDCDELRRSQRLGHRHGVAQSCPNLADNA
nr:rubredoxin [Paraburkholderia kirstenboschensis]